jgi:hypothetical protein
MIVLNPDQQDAVAFFKRWWNSDRRFAILEGAAGTGKTTIVQHLVKELNGCDPLYTASTNEACKQLENVLPYGSLIKTVHSALGFHFNSSSEVKALGKHGGVPTIMNDINLLIVDEASMLGKELLGAIEETGKKTLFIGHRSQLPEVVKNLSAFDDCESVVFKQEYPIYTLTTPERNKGELFTFISSLEEVIYKQPRVFKATYNKTLDFLLDYIDSKEGKKELLTEESKVICWSNAEVDKFNSYIRKSVFNSKELPAFVPKDRIIFTEPVQFVEPLTGLSKTKIANYVGSDKIVNFSANTKGIVRKVGQTTVLHIPCWELEVDCGNGLRPLVYVAIDPRQLAMLESSLKQEAYAFSGRQAREKAFRKYHFIMGLFAKVKHSYAITTHRSQGMTIPNVYVSWSDIRKCQNVYMKHKLLYVAASRARDSLTIIA